MSSLIPPNNITDACTVFSELSLALFRHADASNNIRSALTSARAATLAEWTGDAATAWGENASDVIIKAAEIHYASLKPASYDASQETLKALSTNYQTISRDLDAAESRVRSNGLRMRRLHRLRVVVEAEFTQRGSTMSADPDDVKLAQELELAINDLLRSARDVLEQADECYEVLGGIFRGLVPGTWPEQRVAFENFGICDPERMTPIDLARALATRAQYLDDADRLTPEQLAAYYDFFTDYDADAEVMSMFFATLGGQGTLRLLDQLGWAQASDAVVLGAACALRSGLATASRTWDDKEAEAFVADMFRGIAADDRYEAGAAFLFSGPPFMGPETAYAAADAIDAHVRVNGGGAFGALIDPEGVDTNGGERLARLEQYARGTSEEDLRRVDLAGRIFTTLGEYPDHTTTWLTGKDGDARIDYWFGEYNWAALGDRFEGPAKLLLAAQLTAGGPSDPGSYDENSWMNTAEITSKALNALQENGAAAPGNVSAAASALFATMTAIQLPYVIDDSGLNCGGSSEDLPDNVRHYYLESGDKRPVFAMPLKDFENFLNTMVLVPSEVEVLASGEERVRVPGGVTVLEAYKEQTVSNVTGAGDLEAYVRHIGVLDGLIDGGHRASVEREAAELDARTQAQIDGLATLASAIPLPSVGAFAPAVVDFGTSWVQNVGVTNAVNELGETAGSNRPPSPWSTQNEAEAVLETEEGRTARRKELEENMREQLNRWYEEGIITDLREVEHLADLGGGYWEGTFADFV